MTSEGWIVIANYNSGLHLGRCLASIVRHTPPARVLVVDNASQNGSERVVAQDSRWAPLIRNRRNMGFSSAVNQALARVDGEFVAVLNPDSVLHAGALETLQSELRSCPK